MSAPRIRRVSGSMPGMVIHGLGLVDGAGLSVPSKPAVLNLLKFAHSWGLGFLLPAQGRALNWRRELTGVCLLGYKPMKSIGAGRAAPWIKKLACGTRFRKESNARRLSAIP